MAVDIQYPLRGPSVTLQSEVDATTDVDGATHTVDRTVLVPQGFLARVRLSAVNAGSPTLDLDIEDSWDGVNFNVLISFAQLTGVGEETLVATRLPGPFIRSSALVAGTTPDIDFQAEIIGASVTALV